MTVAGALGRWAEEVEFTKPSLLRALDRWAGECVRKPSLLLRVLERPLRRSLCSIPCIRENIVCNRAEEVLLLRLCLRDLDLDLDRERLLAELNPEKDPALEREELRLPESEEDDRL